jgi:hypothetical protein
MEPTKPLMGIALLNYLQTKLKAPKTQFNKFGGYKYRSLEDIDEALKPLLAETGAAKIRTTDLVLIGNRYYAKVTSRLFDYKGNLVAETVGFAREAENKKGMDVSQITGAAISYAGKYAEAAMFCLDDTKDADATNTHGQEEQDVKNTTQNNKKQIKPFDEIFAQILHEEGITEQTKKPFIAYMKQQGFDLSKAQVRENLVKNDVSFKQKIRQFLSTLQQAS